MRGVGDLNPPGATSVESGRAPFSEATAQNFGGLTSVVEVPTSVEVGLTRPDCSNVAKKLVEALRAALEGDLSTTRKRVAEVEELVNPAVEKR